MSVGAPGASPSPPATYDAFNERLKRLSPGDALKVREKYTRGWLEDTGRTLPELKAQFRRIGYFRGASDDSFSRDFVEAVQAFQRARGLTDDGVCGEQCFGALAHPGPSHS